MASGFIRKAYAVVEDNGIDTTEMTPKEVVEKFNELGGADNWSSKSENYKSKKVSNKSLVNIFKEAEQENKEEQYNYSSPKNAKEVYKKFDAKYNTYKDAQDGEINKDNFFVNTIGKFDKVNNVPKRKPDFISKDRNGKTSSEYWYTEDGVYRRSNHWGFGVASCDWILNESMKKPDTKGFIVLSQAENGFIKWDDLKYKGKVYTLEDTGEEVLDTLNNRFSGDIMEHNGEYYVKPIFGKAYKLYNEDGNISEKAENYFRVLNINVRLPIQN